jgi:type II secretory pathway pseudopilin PulG
MRRRSAQSTRDDRGETLVELMVALAIMGTAVIALVGGIGTFVHTSDIHRKQAKSQAFLREFAETLQSSMATYPTGYVACTTDASTGSPWLTYENLYNVPVADRPMYKVHVLGVAVWNRTTATYTTCPAAGDAGVQRVTLQVYTADTRADERLDIIVRKPCRPPVDPPDPTVVQDATCTT